MCPSLWLQTFTQRSVRSPGLIEIQIIIILILIFWTISGLTVSDHHFDPLPKQELPPSWARHTFILPLTQTERVCCSFRCCSSWTTPNHPSICPSVPPSRSICQDRQQDTLFLPKVVNDGVTETDYMRENSRLLTDSLIPFPNRIVLIPDESHNYSAVNKNFLTVTGGTMGTGFLGRITLVYTVLSNSHLRPLRHTLTKF